MHKFYRRVILIVIGSLLPGQILLEIVWNDSIKPSLLMRNVTFDQRQSAVSLPQSSSNSHVSPLLNAFDQAEFLPKSMADQSGTILEGSNVGYLGQIGGTSFAVAVQGYYAYVGSGPRLVILNILDPAAPVEIGRTVPLQYAIRDVVVEGNYAYVILNVQELFPDASTGGFYIVNIADPATPYKVSYFDTQGRAQGVAAAGGYAYVVEDAGLHVIDVADSVHPMETGYLPVENAQHVEVAGDFAYIGDGIGLHIVDVSDPVAPREVGYYEPPYDLLSVAGFDRHDYTPGSNFTVVGGIAYFAGGYRGLRIVNLTTPANPIEVGVYPMQEAAFSIEVAGSFAYIATTNDGLQIVNIANPESPYKVGQYNIAYPYDVRISGGYALLATRFGLSIVNVSKPSAMYEAARFGIALPNSVALAGNYAYITNRHGLQIINIADYSAPIEMGYYDSPGVAMKVIVVDNYAFIADDNNRLIIVNVANPAAPYEASTYDHPEFNDYVVAGNFVYIAGGVDGLRILDISNPDEPIEAGYFATSSYTEAVDVAGNYVFISDVDDFKIVNILNPVAPVLVGSCSCGRNANDMALAGDYAYTVDYSGLHILNVSDPTYPFEVGFYENNRNTGISHVAIDGSFVYLSYVNGLQIVDVTDPSIPRDAGYYNNNGPYAWDDFYAEAVNGDIYLATGENGLFFLRYIGDADFETKIALPISMR
jgi:hypothetical protein